MNDYFGSDDQPISDINITPFVDVLLVLLIIFMITAPLITYEIPVNLPSSQKGKVPTSGAVDIILTIDQNHRFFLDSTPIADGSLVESLKNKIEDGQNPAIFIQADKQARYGKVAETMATLRNEGITNLNLVIRNEDYAGK